MASLKLKNYKPYERKIKKRCMKNFTESKWKEILANKEWNLENETVEKMAENFNINIEEALDEIAPYKTFTIKSNYKFGISNNTKEMMKKRDKTRANISKAKGNEKITLLNKYKKQRNSVTSQLRKENIDFNNNRVNEAKDDNEIWKIVKEVSNPNKSTEWSIKIGEETTTDEKVIAETFNKYIPFAIKCMNMSL